MDLARYSIERKINTWVIVLICVVGGLISFQGLGRLEDPDFTIKVAVVFTPYPGASAKEVELEVSDRIETAIQQMPQLWYVESKSKPGMSEVTVKILKNYSSSQLPQIWDELRRKVGDVQSQLPPGAGQSIVNDDFGDVFGILIAVTGEGYSYREIYEHVKTLRKQLLLVKGVSKIEIAGKQQEQIFVEIAREKLAQQGISPARIYETLRRQNMVARAGTIRVGEEAIRIQPSGSIDSVREIGNLLIGVGTANQLIRLSDVATVKRGYEEVPAQLIRYNGKPALTVGLSFVSGVNVVKIGQAIDKKLEELQEITPVGIELHAIYEQPSIVDASIRNFVVNLLAAVAIVVVVLLIFMGLRAGSLIGAILFLTVLGTLVFMRALGIDMERISLGAMIIAMGMLVDNAIVVTEGIMVRVQQGRDPTEASSEVVTQNKRPLLGATIVGILAFAPIGLSPDSTGEYTQSLLYVVGISLLLSWVLAVTVTPLFCYYLFTPDKMQKSDGKADPYGHAIFRAYGGFLEFCMKHRWATVGALVGMLGLALFGFGFVKQSFFPDSTTPIFYVDYWRPQGTDIRNTGVDAKTIEQHLAKMKGVQEVTTVIGRGATRFMLVYAPEQPNSSYAQFIVRVDDYTKIPDYQNQILAYLRRNFPDSEPVLKNVRLGPGRDFKIETRFSGPDPKVLRRLSAEAQGIYVEDGGLTGIRDDWRQRVKMIRPLYSESKARSAGISRKALADALQVAFSGLQVGVYREADELVPIIARSPDRERLDARSIANIQIWSPVLGGTIPISQVTNGVRVRNEDTLIRRRDRLRTFTVSANPKTESASDVLKRIKPKIEAITLPPGYKFAWGGEFEDSKMAQEALFGIMPLGFLAMILVVIWLFGKPKQPLIIWLCVPLAIIGVTAGLLATGQAFGFMALLGMLSLSGMLIKNAIVLIDQIDRNISKGKRPYQSIIDAGLSRLRPVSMAAITTILGMIPLLTDAFFVSMAVTIMAGLAFATVLTMIVVPVLYAIFFDVRADDPVSQRA